MNNCCNRSCKNCCCNNVISIPGPQGRDGEAATIAIGTTTTGNPGTNAIVTNSGTTSNAILNFTIPRGEPSTINTGCFISRSNQTLTKNNQTLQFPITLNSDNITINGNDLIIIPKTGKYMINYGVKTITNNNIIGIFINGVNNLNTNINTNNYNINSSIILQLNQNDNIVLGVTNATDITPLILEESTINAYLTIISLD